MFDSSSFDLNTFRSLPLPSEDEIISRWNNKYERPVASVLCNTYNQEKYIEDAIRGFLLQKTDFPFEVIVHDDASIDKNPTIIQEYARKYPSIIKPVFQKENQYSKGIKPTLLSFSYAKGKYIALCEGDDFWIWDKKLQRQVECAKSSGCQIVFSSAVLLRNEKINGFTARHKSISGIIPHKKVVFGGGSYCPTASLLIDRIVLDELKNEDWFINAPIGDLYIQAFASISKGAYFLNKNTCVYRQRANGSWSVQKRGKDKEIFDLERNIQSIKGLSKYFINSREYLESQMISQAYYYTALQLLKSKNYDEYRYFMRMAKKNIRHESKGFKVFYGLSCFPKFANIIRAIVQSY